MTLRLRETPTSPRSRTISISRSRSRKELQDDVLDPNSIQKIVKSMDHYTDKKIVDIAETYISMVDVLQKNSDALYESFQEFLSVIYSNKASNKVLKQNGGFASMSMGLNAARIAKNKKRNEARKRAHKLKKKMHDDKMNEKHAKEIQENTTQIGPYGLELDDNEKQSYSVVDFLNQLEEQQKLRDNAEKDRIWKLGEPQRQMIHKQLLGQQAEVRTHVTYFVAFLGVILLLIDRKKVISFINSFFTKPGKPDDFEDDKPAPWIKVDLPPTYTSNTRSGRRYTVETKNRPPGYKYIRGGKSKKMRRRNITRKKGY